MDFHLMHVTFINKIIIKKLINLRFAHSCRAVYLYTQQNNDRIKLERINWFGVMNENAKSLVQTRGSNFRQWNNNLMHKIKLLNHQWREQCNSFNWPMRQWHKLSRTTYTKRLRLKEEKQKIISSHSLRWNYLVFLLNPCPAYRSIDYARDTSRHNFIRLSFSSTTACASSRDRTTAFG